MSARTSPAATPARRCRRAAALSAAATTALALTVAAPVARAGVTTYTISGMGIPEYPAGGTYNGGSGADAISNTGYVTGYLQGISGYSQPFEYRNGTLTQLPTLGGRSGFGIDVNDLGQVAGYSRIAGATPTAATPTNAAVWTGGSPQSLGTLGGTNSFGEGINDAGQVAGYSQISSGIYHAFRTNNGVLSDLGTLGGPNSYGNVVNGAGVVAGASDLTGAPTSGSGPYQGVYWDASGTIHAIPGLGGTQSSAYDINAAGVITGYSNLPGDADQRAILYTPSGTLTNLGYADAAFPESQGQSINDLNQVVGEGFTTDFSDERAFVYTDGQMYDLSSLVTTPGWTLQYALGNNDDGQIVGQGIDPAGYEHAFLLTPTGVSVPEPTTLSLAAVGLLGRRRPRRGGAAVGR